MVSLLWLSSSPSSVYFISHFSPFFLFVSLTCFSFSLLSLLYLLYLFQVFTLSSLQNCSFLPQTSLSCQGRFKVLRHDQSNSAEDDPYTHCGGAYRPYVYVCLGHNRYVIFFFVIFFFVVKSIQDKYFQTFVQSSHRCSNILLGQKWYISTYVHLSKQIF